MRTVLYRSLLVAIFLCTGCFAAWLLDDNNLPQGTDTIEEVKKAITQRHVEMAMGGLIAGGLSILIVDQLRKRFTSRKAKEKGSY